jgi:hypothetical protein
MAGIAMTEEQTKHLKEKLLNSARAKFPHDAKRQRAYVFGALRRTGWKPSNQR